MKHASEIFEVYKIFARKHADILKDIERAAMNAAMKGITSFYYSFANAELRDAVCKELRELGYTYCNQQGQHFNKNLWVTISFRPI